MLAEVEGDDDKDGKDGEDGGFGGWGWGFNSSSSNGAGSAASSSSAPVSRPGARHPHWLPGQPLRGHSFLLVALLPALTLGFRV